MLQRLEASRRTARLAGRVLTQGGLLGLCLMLACTHPSEPSGAAPGQNPAPSSRQPGPPSAPGNPSLPSPGAPFRPGDTPPPVPLGAPIPANPAGRFPGGIEGTEFVPQPSFYNEDTWGGLRLRLNLYLTYARKDLAVAALRRQDPLEALRQYTLLSEGLRSSPVSDPILHEIQVQLERFAWRGQLFLLTQLGRQAEARALLPQALDPQQPVDGAFQALLEAQWLLAAQPEQARSRLMAAREGFLSLSRGLPWQPQVPGASRTQAERHGDRLDRVSAYVRFFNPLSTRLVWGSWTELETWRQVWVGALAASWALEADKTGQAGLVEAVLKGAAATPGLRVQTLPATRQARNAREPLAGLALADETIRLAEELHPRTSAWLLQGMPTGDSYVDTLGQAGSPAAGELEKLSLRDPAYRALTEEYVQAINQALEAGQPGQAAEAVDRLLKLLDAQPFQSRYFNLKKVRNEAVRLFALSGRPDMALGILKGAYPLGDLDYRCPNRMGILKAMEGRLLLEAGKAKDAQQALEAALGHAERWRGYVDRFGPRPGGGGQP